MGYIFIIFVVTVVIFTILKQNEKSKGDKDKQTPPTSVKPKVPKPQIKILNRDGDSYEDEYHTYIAGVNHHASKYDIGGFCGWITNDFTNDYNPKAMGIYNSFGKLLGYIPEKELKDYLRWCRNEPTPCVGFIFIEDGMLCGRVKTLLPCNKDFMETEFTKYLQWVRDNYGSSFIPKTMTIEFQTNDE